MHDAGGWEPSSSEASHPPAALAAKLIERTRRATPYSQGKGS